MKQWDVFMYPFSKERRHPAVILSNDETCQNGDLEEVNLHCFANIREGDSTAQTDRRIIGRVRMASIGKQWFKL